MELFKTLFILFSSVDPKIAMTKDPEDAKNSATRSGRRPRNAHAFGAYPGYCLAGPTAEKPVLPPALVASCEAGAQQAGTIKKEKVVSSSRRRPVKVVSVAHIQAMYL